MILNDTSIYEKLRSCPKLNTNKSVWKGIREIAAKCPEPRFFNRFFSNNCNLAYFYGIPKLHKPNIPLRPIISSSGTVTRRLAGWLASLLTPYLGKFSTAHLRNSLDFKNRLEEFCITNDISDVKMVSFDVTALFTSMPLDVTLAFIEGKEKLCALRCI